MKTQKPTPLDLAQIAIALSPDAMRNGIEEEKEKALADAFRILKMAGEVVDHEGKTQDEVILERIAGSKSDRQSSEMQTYSLEEAWRKLGYKDTRGKRSLLGLVEAASEYGAFGEPHVPGGIVKWISGLGQVDHFQLSLLQEFKADRAAKKVRAGGLAKAAKVLSNKSQRISGD